MRFNDDVRSLEMSRLIWGLVIFRWIGGSRVKIWSQGWKSRHKGAVASGAGGSELCGVYEGKVAVDIYAGKRGIDVGNYIFPFASNLLSIRK